MSRILVLDDDNDILRYCEIVLSKNGHEALVCNEAYTALDLLQKYNVDLLVVDVVMPNVDGFSFLKTVARLKSVMPPVLMLTGRRSPNDIRTALDLGATDYMVKPFDKDVFLSKVNSILGKQPPRQQVTFAEGAVNSRAELVLTSHIVGITEMGMTLRTVNPVERNSRMVVKASIFDEIGIECPTLRAASCIEIEDSGGMNYQYEVFVSFVGLDEFAMQKIRRWISSRTIALYKKAEAS